MRRQWARGFGCSLFLPLLLLLLPLTSSTEVSAVGTTSFPDSCRNGLRVWHGDRLDEVETDGAVKCYRLLCSAALFTVHGSFNPANETGTLEVFVNLRLVYTSKGDVAQAFDLTADDIVLVLTPHGGFTAELDFACGDGGAHGYAFVGVVVLVVLLLIIVCICGVRCLLRSRSAQLMRRERYQLLQRHAGIRYHAQNTVESLATLQVGYGATDFAEPPHMVCPISLQLMRDPVFCGCAVRHTFERSCLEAHLKRHASCPLSRTELTSEQITPNSKLRLEIRKLVKHHRGEKKHKKASKDDPPVITVAVGP